MQFAVAHASLSPTDSIPLEYNRAFPPEIFAGLIVQPPIFPSGALNVPLNAAVPSDFI